MRYAGTRLSEHNLLRTASAFETGLSVKGSSEPAPVLMAAQAMREKVLTQHPDAALLMLCDELRTLQEEWQFLWAATPEVGESSSDDAAWRDYSDHVWPRVGRQDVNCDGEPVRGLITIKAATFESMCAKAAAIKALDGAGSYLMSIRDDSYELMMSLLQDVAGPAAMPMGDDAQPKVAHASIG